VFFLISFYFIKHVSLICIRWLLGIPSFCFVVGLILDRTPPQYLPIIELCLPISFGVLLITLFLVFSSNVIQIRTSRADRRLLVTKLFEGLSILTDKLISPFLAHFLVIHFSLFSHFFIFICFFFLKIYSQLLCVVERVV
jgi:hypothetical protein